MGSSSEFQIEGAAKATDPKPQKAMILFSDELSL